MKTTEKTTVHLYEKEIIINKLSFPAFSDIPVYAGTLGKCKNFCKNFMVVYESDRQIQYQDKIGNEIYQIRKNNLI